MSRAGLIYPTYDQHLLSAVHCPTQCPAECLEPLKHFLASQAFSVLPTLGIPDLSSGSDQPRSNSGC